MRDLYQDTSAIPTLSNDELWFAAVTVCDETDDVRVAAYLLQMLGLIVPAPAEQGYVPVCADDLVEPWYPPSPFTQPYARIVAALPAD